jgi:hypothetical protein
MWRQYPFGALLLDETWAWWSVAQVAADGRNCAKDAGHSNGVVVASTSVSLAVLDWTDGTRSESMIFIVAKYAGVAAAAPRVALTHEKFMQDTGFDREDKLLGCCFCGRNLTLAAPAALAARAPVDTKKINAPQLDVTMGMLHEAIQHQGVPSQTPRQAVRAPNGYSHQTRAMQHGHPASSGLTHSNVLSGHQRWSSTNV